MHLHSESVFGQFSQLRAREHCLLPPVAPVYTSASNVYKCFFLTGPIPSSLGNCVNLTHLHLSQNQLTGKCVNDPSCCFALNFSQSLFLTGPIPDTLGKCIKLEHLYLHENQLTGKCKPTRLFCLTIFLVKFFTPARS